MVAVVLVACVVAIYCSKHLLRVDVPLMGPTRGDPADQTYRSASPELEGNTHEKHLRTLSADTILGRLRIAADKMDANELISLVPILMEKDMLLDPEVVKVFEYRISNFTADQLAELANAWPDQENTLYSFELDVIAELIAGRDDPDQYFSLLSKMSPEKPSRGSMISTMVQKMSMFSAQEIGRYLARFSKNDLQSVAEGLAARSENSSDSKEKKIELLNQYIGAIQNVEVLGPLVKLHLSLSALDDPLRALKWVSEQDPAVVRMCDKPLIQSLIKDHPVEATNYVNAILAGDDRRRADKALEYMVASYSKVDPQAALNWVLNLPEEVQPTDQMFATPFIKLKRSNPQRAKEILDAIQDPRLKSLLERVSR